MNGLTYYFQMEDKKNLYSHIDSTLKRLDKKIDSYKPLYTEKSLNIAKKLGVLGTG